MDETLSDLLKNQNQLNIKKIFTDILKSVLQLHEHYVIHRDIKPANIMLSHSTGIMKVIDYGMAKEIEFEDRPMTNEVGSLYYRAPELLLGSKRYDFSVDVWSLGCVFYEMLTRKVLFKGENQLDQVKKIFKVTGTPKS
jgi:serine/threonine protein kinase